MPKEIRVQTEKRNSAGVRVSTAGISMERFKRNPIMLFNHRRAFHASEPLPIGMWENLRVEDAALFATPNFDLEDDFAAKVASKYERGYLRAASVGLKIHELTTVAGEDGSEDVVISKSELWEISIVDIPANDEAVVFYGDNEEPLTEEAVLALAAKANQSELNIKPNTMPNYSNVPGLLGLAAEADEQTVQAKIEELKVAGERVTQLEQQVETLQAAAAQREQADIEEMVDAALKAGKITAEQKPTYLKLAQADLESTRQVLETLQPVQKLADVPKKKFTAGAKESTGEPTFSQLQKEDPQKLAQLKANDPETFNQLYKAEFGSDWRE